MPLRERTIMAGRSRRSASVKEVAAYVVAAVMIAYALVLMALLAADISRATALLESVSTGA